MEKRNFKEEFKNVEKLYLVTHAGSYHGDDAMSTALLILLCEKFNIQYEVIRLQNWELNDFLNDFDKEELGNKVFVYDMGGKSFDHHQENAEYRKNGRKYASLGLIWAAYGHHFLPDEDVEKIDNDIIVELDDCDCFGTYNSIAEMICMYNPTWYELEKNPDFNMMEAFMNAVFMSISFFERTFAKIEAEKEATEVVKTAILNMEDKIIILPKFVVWEKLVVETDAEYIIFPSNRGGYACQAIRKDMTTRETRKPFPKEWWCKKDKELEEITGIKGFDKCLDQGWICFLDTLENAIKAAKYSQNH